MTEIITLKKIVQDVEDKKISEEDASELALRCENCGHRDILDKFLVDDIPGYIMGQPSQSQNQKYRYYQGLGAVNHLSFLRFHDKIRKDNLICPKCGSSLITFDEKLSSNNTIKYIKNESSK